MGDIHPGKQGLRIDQLHSQIFCCKCDCWPNGIERSLDGLVDHYTAIGSALFEFFFDPPTLPGFVELCSLLGLFEMGLACLA
jgi:hypothetical protein